MTPTRAITVTPLDTEVGNVVVLPKMADPATFSYTTGGWIDWSEVVAAGDVLGLVEECPHCENGLWTCNRCKPKHHEFCPHCTVRGDDDWTIISHGHLLVGTVTVDEVIPVYEYVDDAPDSITLIEVVGINGGPNLWRAGNDIAPEVENITLPSPPSPGSVLLRVTVDRTVECETCGGEGNAHVHGQSGYHCPDCTNGRIPFPVRAVHVADPNAAITTITEGERT